MANLESLAARDERRDPRGGRVPAPMRREAQVRREGGRVRLRAGIASRTDVPPRLGLRPGHEGGRRRSARRAGDLGCAGLSRRGDRLPPVLAEGCARAGMERAEAGPAARPPLRSEEAALTDHRRPASHASTSMVETKPDSSPLAFTTGNPWTCRDTISSATRCTDA